jgi:hypothetical protein
MPGGDRTGPWGMGQMTGRRVGYCAGYDAPGYANPVPGRGYGRGGGRGWFGGWGYGRGGGVRGWRHRFYASGRPGWARGAYAYGPTWEYARPPTPEQELDNLKHEADWLKSQLDAIGQRIEQIEGE